MVRYAVSPFSLEGDPLFTVGVTLVGLFVLQASCSVLLYHFLVGLEDEKSQFAVLMGFVSFGFSSAVLRVTLPIVVRWFQRTI